MKDKYIQCINGQILSLDKVILSTFNGYVTIYNDCHNGAIFDIPTVYRDAFGRDHEYSDDWDLDVIECVFRHLMKCPEDLITQSYIDQVDLTQLYDKLDQISKFE